MMTTISAVNLSILICLLTCISACGSTTPTKQRPNADTTDKGLSSSSLQNARLLQNTIDKLTSYNNDPIKWDMVMQQYLEQTQSGSASRYRHFSSRLHETESNERCSRKSIIAIQNALQYHPSSLPMLSYALECAERFERADQQDVIANSIGIVGENLIATVGKGESRYSPLSVRELYEGEYLLDLAGIEVFDTEILLENDRLIILHHGIDKIANTYSLSFADQSAFFIRSLSASLSKVELTNLPDRASFIKLKRSALLEGNHYSMQLWDLRQQLFNGNYSEVISQLTLKKHNSPMGISMLAQAYMATNDAVGINSIENELIHYANLGIPELQAVASIMLLKMTNPEGSDFTRTRLPKVSKGSAQDLGLILAAFNQTEQTIGLDNASLIWVRTILGDSSLGTFVPLIVNVLPASALEAWKETIDYIAASQVKGQSELANRIKEFTLILDSVAVKQVASR